MIIVHLMIYKPRQVNRYLWLCLYKKFDSVFIFFGVFPNKSNLAEYKDRQQQLIIFAIEYFFAFEFTFLFFANDFILSQVGVIERLIFRKDLLHQNKSKNYFSWVIQFQISYPLFILRSKIYPIKCPLFFLHENNELEID